MVLRFGAHRLQIAEVCLHLKPRFLTDPPAFTDLSRLRRVVRGGDVPVVIRTRQLEIGVMQRLQVILPFLLSFELSILSADRLFVLLIQVLPQDLRQVLVPLVVLALGLRVWSKTA